MKPMYEIGITKRYSVPFKIEDRFIFPVACMALIMIVDKLAIIENMIYHIAKDAVNCGTFFSHRLRM